ncbi:MAG: NUDIX hydrolase [Bacteriovorax sp.]|nr:NUDIX hydrolase [Bacteriovorax sp.]
MKKNLYYYQGENPTVDLIVVNPNGEVLIIRRSSQSVACPSMYAFPGGFIDSKALAGELWESGLETPKEAAIRELAEETNLILKKDIDLISVGEYVGNNRDPRDNEYSWSKTHAFLFLIDLEIFESQKKRIKGMDDADLALWINISELQKTKLAFDHNQILIDAIALIRERTVR